MKNPIFNNHKCRGFYHFDFLPIHYCSISHLIIGLLSLKFKFLIPLFLIYQISQMVYKYINQKGKPSDDIVDIIEFFIARSIFLVVYKYLKKF